MAKLVMSLILWGQQGDPLRTDLFGVLIEILYEMMRVICPDVGVELGGQKVPCSFCG